MKDDIEAYEPKEPSIVAVGAHRVRAYVGDQTATLHAIMWVGDTPTRIVSLAGGRRAEAICFDTTAVATGDAVQCAPAYAGWPAPTEGCVRLEELRFEPGRQDPERRPPGDLAPRPTGIEILDGALPVAGHGVTLVLDCGAPDAVFDRILGAVARPPFVCASARPVPGATHQILAGPGLGFATAVQWAQQLGGTLLIEGSPFDLDEVLDGVACTVLVRVQLREGLEILAETLDLGHSDTQILLREDGTIDLTRSMSRLVPEDPRFQTLADLRHKRAIFGEFDLEPHELAVLRDADRLEAGLLFGDEDVTG